MGSKSGADGKYYSGDFVFFFSSSFSKCTRRVASRRVCVCVCVCVCVFAMRLYVLKVVF